MKNYKIVWFEFHVCYSNGDIDDIVRTNKQLNIDTQVIGNTDPDDKYYIEFECKIYFQAKNNPDAFRKVYCDLYVEADTYSIFDDNNKVIATEEGLISDNEAFCPYCNCYYTVSDGHSCWEYRSGLE